MPKKTGQLKDPAIIRAVGDRFRRERKDLGITHDWLSTKTGVERFSIGRFEAGTRGIESSALVAILCAVAEQGADVGFVLTGSRDPALVAIRAALQDPAIRTGLREAGLQAIAKQRAPAVSKK